ncbi:MAG: hypothetical protein M1826_006296 [Phylliscum demangeonii]|nr:MAG: hypothetical protein M1826_006296 [Phylliscum demangeonii]
MSQSLVQPTPKEAFFMLHVLHNQEGKPKVNWDKVAAAMELKNGSTAYVRFGQIKKRLGWMADGGPAKAESGGVVLGGAKVTKTPRGRLGSKAKKPKGKGMKKDEMDVEVNVNGDVDVEMDGQGGVEEVVGQAVVKPDEESHSSKVDLRSGETEGEEHGKFEEG